MEIILMHQLYLHKRIKLIKIILEHKYFLQNGLARFH